MVKDKNYLPENWIIIWNWNTDFYSICFYSKWRMELGKLSKIVQNGWSGGKSVLKNPIQNRIRAEWKIQWMLNYKNVCQIGIRCVCDSVLVFIGFKSLGFDIKFRGFGPFCWWNIRRYKKMSHLLNRWHGWEWDACESLELLVVIKA